MFIKFLFVWTLSELDSVNEASGDIAANDDLVIGLCSCCDGSNTLTVIFILFVKQVPPSVLFIPLNVLFDVAIQKTNKQI